MALRTNERISVPVVRLLAADGEQLGHVATEDALRMAREAGLDLVELYPTAKPPVCRIMDYGRYLDELKKRD